MAASLHPRRLAARCPLFAAVSSAVISAAVGYPAAAADTPTSFNPFAPTDAGFKLDPSLMASMYQDSTGTTPVTAVEQPVGLRLDTRNGLARGADFADNGGFSGGTAGWTAVNGGVLAAASGGASITNVGGALESSMQNTTAAAVIGKTYEITLDKIAATHGGAVGIGGVRATLAGGNGPRRAILTATSTQALRIYTNSITDAASITVDNVSVREIPGTHFAQPTAANRGVLTSRVNLLPSSDLTQAVVGVIGSGGSLPTGWAFNPQAGLTKEVVAKGTLPDGAPYIDIRVSGTNTSGSTSSDLYMITSGSAPIAQGGTARASIRGQVIAGSNTGFNHAAGRRLSIAGFSSVGGFVEGNNDVNYLDDINARRSLSRTMAGATVTNARCYVDFAIPNGNTVDLTLRISQPQLEYGAATTKWQRVSSATDYDAAGFPLGIRYDGVDDGYVSLATVDFTGTDKVTAWTALTKLSDATLGVLYEFSGASGSNPGTFGLFCPVSAGPNYGFRSGGTTPTVPTGSPFAAPDAALITTVGNISADVAVLRRNGVQVANSATDQGSGNFGAYPFYIGRRASTSQPFNGIERGITVLGRLASAGEITTGEQFYAIKNGWSSIAGP